MFYSTNASFLEALENPPDQVIEACEATSQTLHTRFDGAEVVWRTWGAGPAVILLHGGTGSWLHWIRTIPHLMTDHTVLVPDLPGMGDSSLPSTTTPVEALIEDSAHLLARSIPLLVTGSAPVQLVGFSFGSMVAAHVAARLGRRATTLGLVGSSGFGLSFRGVSGLKKPEPSLSDTALRALHRHNMCTIMFGDEANADELALEMQLHNAARMRIRSHESAHSKTMLDALPAINADIFAIWGANDPFQPDDINAARTLLERESKGSVSAHLVSGAGHWVAYEASNLFNALLSEELNS
ncbi:MAG: alpha/beta hydrolase [Pseudomonadota bacterium]